MAISFDEKVVSLIKDSFDCRRWLVCEIGSLNIKLPQLTAPNMTRGRCKVDAGYRDFRLDRPHQGFALQPFLHY